MTDRQLQDDLDCFRSWTSGPESIEDEAARRVGARALELFAREYVSERTCSDELLDAVVAAAKCEETFVGVMAVTLLRHLAASHESARQAVRDLLHDALPEKVRVGAVLVVDAMPAPPPLPREFVVDVLRRATRDPTPRVRHVAACTAAMRDVHELLDDVLRVRDQTANRDDRGWLDLYVDLLRDGYSLEEIPADDEAWKSVTSLGRPLFGMKVRCDGSLYGHVTDARTLEAQGAPAIAEDVRRRVRAQRKRHDQA